MKNFDNILRSIKSLLKNNKEEEQYFLKNIFNEVKKIEESIKDLKEAYHQVVVKGDISEEKNRNIQKFVIEIFSCHYIVFEKLKFFSDRYYRGKISPSISKNGKCLNSIRGKITHKENPIYIYYDKKNNSNICNTDNAYIDPYVGETVKIDVRLDRFSMEINKFCDDIEESIFYTLNKYYERLRIL